MDGQCNKKDFLFFFFLFLSLSFYNKVSLAAKHNPFTSKAFLDRYWSKHVTNNYPKPQFLFSKASPLTHIDSAKLTTLLSSQNCSIKTFCSLANLYCSFDSQPQGQQSDISGHNQDSNFAHYSSKNFANYGTSKLGGVDSFRNYSDGLNTPNESFKMYSKSSTKHSEGFTNYAKDGNVANDNFTSYGSGATGGSGEFNNYQERVNVPNLRFTSYDSDGNNHKLTFTTYSDDTNSGSEGFLNYGKNGNSVPTEFTHYADNANTIGSSFVGYGESGNAANDSFKGYGDTGNNPHNNFKSYGIGGNSGIDSFISYRDGANVGEDSFQSYGRNSNSGRVSFTNYGKTFNLGNDSFKDYGRGSKGHTTIDFKSYNLDRSFIAYNQNGVTFASYNNVSSTVGENKSSGISVNKWVEPGKFFRESVLKEGCIVVMPDIRDKMPQRSFLPRPISSKFPFSSSQLSAIKRIFEARDNSTTERVLQNALVECERPPSQGETKRCVGSVEDMIDFATSVLGHNVVVRTTENVEGSKQRIVIGKVQEINGGKVTKSVSCHQSLYPYLLYYCHSVPKVRVYAADILDVETKTKINHGVAICHLDTSAWSPNHGAFVALGSSPGKIEVCHWIFENDVTWTSAD